MVLGIVSVPEILVPLVVFVNANCIASWTLTQPPSGLRQLSYACFTVAVLTTVWNINKIHSVSAYHRSSAAMMLLPWILHTANILFIQEMHVALPAETHELKAAQRYRIAYKRLYNGRWVSTDDPAPAVKHTRIRLDTASAKKCHENEVLARSSVGMHRAELLSRCLANVVLFAGVLQAYTELASLPERFDRHYQHCQSSPYNAFWCDLLLRLWTVGHYLITNYCALSLYHQALALMFVAIGLHDPVDWPPFFGNATEAFSVRRFWSRFWHQIAYRTFKNHARVIVRHVLRLQVETTPGRLAEGMVVFLISGILHAVVANRVGIQGVAVAEIVWFMLQPTAMLLETSIQVMADRTIGPIHSGAPWARLVGHIWLVGFFMWALPLRFWTRWST